ncbi:MAG: ParB/RepB/Spo0J family partition protein [Armatimonadota bacterium]
MRRKLPAPDNGIFDIDAGTPGIDYLIKTAPEPPKEIPISLIDEDPDQPRKTKDSAKMRELEDSIRVNGVMQTIVVRPIEGGRYMIVVGERRYTAARNIGLQTILAVVRDLPILDVRFWQFAENMVREELTDVDKGIYLTGLMKQLREAGVDDPWGTISSRTGLSRNSLDVLREASELSPTVQEMMRVNPKGITLTHAHELHELSTQPSLQEYVGRAAQNERLTVKQTGKVVDRILAMSSSGTLPSSQEAAEVTVLHIARRVKEEAKRKIQEPADVDSNKKRVDPFLGDTNVEPAIDEIKKRVDPFLKDINSPDGPKEASDKDEEFDYQEFAKMVDGARREIVTALSISQNGMIPPLPDDVKHALFSLWTALDQQKSRFI